MKIHLIRMAAGIGSLGELRQRHSDQLSKSGKSLGKLYTYTRNMPMRVNELTEGGSIYWVIKRFIRARQKIISIEKKTNEEGRVFCAIVLDRELIPVIPRRQNHSKVGGIIRMKILREILATVDLSILKIFRQT